MATKAEIRNRALEDLGALQIGQSPEAQDATRVEASFDEVYADLKDEGLATWASTGSVPDKLVPHVAALVASDCMDVYGVSPQRYARIAGRAALAKREIRRLTSPPYESLDDPADF